MKRINHIKTIVLIIVCSFFIACEKDNYEAPSSFFEGTIQYNGEPIHVEFGQVAFELWQSGFGKSGAIHVAVNQDGSFSSLLFDGEYKMVFSNNQGPFLWKRNAAGTPDTIAIQIKGNKKMDIEVIPYYMIRNAQMTLTGKKLTATCKLEKVTTDMNARNIERVSLYVNKTQFVSGNGTQHIARKDLGSGAIADINHVILDVDIPDIIPTQNYVFARIGLKIAGVEDMIFSPLQKITY